MNNLVVFREREKKYFSIQKTAHFTFKYLHSKSNWFFPCIIVDVLCRWAHGSRCGWMFWVLVFISCQLHCSSARPLGQQSTNITVTCGLSVHNLTCVQWDLWADSQPEWTFPVCSSQANLICTFQSDRVQLMLQKYSPIF